MFGLELIIDIFIAKNVILNIKIIINNKIVQICTYFCI